VQFPIIIGVHRSRFLDALLVLLALLAVSAILAFHCPQSIRAGLLILVLLLTSLAWRGLTPTLRSIRLERSGEILVARIIGETDFVPALPRPGATIHPWLMVITLDLADGRPATLILTVNRKNSQNLKCLRVFMRWQAKFTESGDAA